MTGLVLSNAGVVLNGEAAGAGPPVVLLHAGGERRGVWRPVARALEDAGCSSVAYDLRGHGYSDGPAERLDDFAGDVSRMIDVTSAAPVLVGASLGGFAAMLALADRALEHRTAGLVLVDVVPDPPPAQRVRGSPATSGRGQRPGSSTTSSLADPSSATSSADCSFPSCLSAAGGPHCTTTSSASPGSRRSA